MGSFKEYLRRKSDERAKRRSDQVTLRSALHSIENIDEWPKWAENDDSILQFLHNSTHLPTKYFAQEEIDEIRYIFDSITSLPQVEEAKLPERVSQEYLGISIKDPWRERHDYLALELVPEREIYALFINGYILLGMGEKSQIHIDKDSQLEKRLLAILLNHEEQRFIFARLRGENHIHI